MEQTPTEVTVEPTKTQVLVVEDEPDQQDLLEFHLTRSGYQVTVIDNGQTAVETIRQGPPDLVVLDLMLPGMDGIEVCKHIKSDPVSSKTPVLMLTARSEESDMVTGLEIGADDYVTKPYSPRVLLARIKAVLRRKAAMEIEKSQRAAQSDDAMEGDDPSLPPIEGGTIQREDMTIRPERFEVIVNGKSARLSGTEFRLLHFLARQPGRVFSRDQILKAIHGESTVVTDRSVDVHIFWLRQKIGVKGRLIEAVRGVGYRFRDESA